MERERKGGKAKVVIRERRNDGVKRARRERAKAKAQGEGIERKGKKLEEEKGKIGSKEEEGKIRRKVEIWNGEGKGGKK